MNLPALASWVTMVAVRTDYSFGGKQGFINDRLAGKQLDFDFSRLMYNNAPPDNSTLLSSLSAPRVNIAKMGC